MFREGRVVGCSSNEPATLMGQFLLSRGKITRNVLSEAMRLHKQSKDTLGEILLKIGAISPADRQEFVASKIEETIYGLFDWSNAVFRFYTDALPDPNSLEVDLEIREVLQRGLQRCDERERSREAITDLGIVLRRTGRPEPPELKDRPAARRIFELVDGKKTVAEILLHSHAPEFLAIKLLSVLLQSQVVETIERTADSPSASEQVTCVTKPDDPLAEPDDSLEEARAALDSPEAEIESLMASAEQVEESIVIEQPVAADPERGEDDPSRELQEEINVALQLMSSGQAEAALELLNAMSAAHPADISIRKLINNAERDYREQMFAGELGASKIPVRTSLSESSPGEKMTAEESFLLEHIDGNTEIQALLWVTPMRDVEVFKTLSRLLGKGWIEVREAA
jgi:hypothetical protein